MDLKEFVDESLRQIMDGVNAAKEYGKTIGAKVNPAGTIPNYKAITDATIYQLIRRDDGNSDCQFAQNVSFDVAVTATEETQKEGGAKLNVVAISFGGKIQSETTNSSISRVKFTVPVFLP